MTKARAGHEKSASDLISERIAELGDWRGDMLRRVRKLTKDADPEIVEEWKWRGTPVWSDNGIVCTGESYKSVVKLTFARGASLEDPASLFNASMDGNVRRAIDLHQGDRIDEPAFQDLIRAAAALNSSGKRPSQSSKRGVSLEQARALLLAHSEVRPGRSYGMPSYLLRGRFFARFRDDDTVLVLRLGSIDDRDVLMQLDARSFFFTDHYRDYPAVLVRLAEIRPSLLSDVVGRAWTDAVAQIPARATRRRAATSTSSGRRPRGSSAESSPRPSPRTRASGRRRTSPRRSSR